MVLASWVLLCGKNVNSIMEWRPVLDISILVFHLKSSIPSAGDQYQHHAHAKNTELELPGQTFIQILHLEQCEDDKEILPRNVTSRGCICACQHGFIITVCVLMFCLCKQNKIEFCASLSLDGEERGRKKLGQKIM